MAVEEGLHYQCLRGKYSARQQVAKWLSVRAGRQLEAGWFWRPWQPPIEALGFALCDPGKVILIPAPGYCGFIMIWKTGRRLDSNKLVFIVVRQVLI